MRGFKCFEHIRSFSCIIWGFVGMDFCWSDEMIALKESRYDRIFRIATSMIWLRIVILFFIGYLCVFVCCCAVFCSLFRRANEAPGQ